MKQLLFGLVLIVTFIEFQSTSLAQEAKALAAETEAAKKDGDKKSKERLDYMYNSAAGFVGKRSSDGAKVKIYNKPLLRFTNPLHGCREGLFVAWVDEQNRPVAAGQIFLMRGTENNWYIETQSIADCPINLESKSNGLWAPTKAGIKWTKFKDAPRPADKKQLRLAHMRRLADRFRVEDDLNGDEDVLRLMPSPMIRYEDADKGVIDGSLFAYVQGTDPELLVQVEAREDTDGERSYHWALSAMTSAKVVAYLDEERVWSKEQSSGSQTEIFYMRQLSGGVPYPME